jgi:hypothetical protein
VLKSTAIGTKARNCGRIASCNDGLALSGVFFPFSFQDFSSIAGQHGSFVRNNDWPSGAGYYRRHRAALFDPALACARQFTFYLTRGSDSV